MDFKNVKGKHIVFGLLAVSIITVVASNMIKDVRRSSTAKKAYGDKNVAIAQRLYNAMYPEGRSNSKFSFFNPLSIINVVKDEFKASPNVDKLMQIARDEINSDNFGKISKAYHKLYGSDLILDLQDVLDEDFLRFDDLIKAKEEVNENPDKHFRYLDNLADLLHTDLCSFGLADNSLYEQLYDLSDDDFIYVYNQFRVVADKNGTDDSLAEEIADDNWTISLSNELKARFRELGLK